MTTGTQGRSGANGVRISTKWPRSEAKINVNGNGTFWGTILDTKSAPPINAAPSASAPVPTTIDTVTESIGLTSTSNEDKKEEANRRIQNIALEMQKIRDEYDAKEKKLRHTTRMHLRLLENRKNIKEVNALEDEALGPVATLKKINPDFSVAETNRAKVASLNETASQVLAFGGLCPNCKKAMENPGLGCPCQKEKARLRVLEAAISPLALSY